MKRYSTQGFTLLEVLLVLALFSLVSSGLFLLNWAFFSSSERQAAICEANQYSRTAMHWIIQDIHSSYPVSTDMINSEQLVLYLPLEGKPAEEIRYFISDENLRRNNLALVQNINYLSFNSNSDAELIIITVESSVNNHTYRLTAAARSRLSTILE